MISCLYRRNGSKLEIYGERNILVKNIMYLFKMFNTNILVSTLQSKREILFSIIF